MIGNFLAWASDQILALDPEVRAELADFAGKIIKVELSGLDLAFYVQLTPTGLQCLLTTDQAPDAVIRGTPVALALLGLQQRLGWAARPQGVEIQGNVELVHQLTVLMKKFRLDWEELIAQVIGDRAAQTVGGSVRNAGEYGAQAAQRFQDNVVDYLQEELRLLPPHEEVADFMADVDELRDSVERLIARVRAGRDA